MPSFFFINKCKDHYCFSNGLCILGELLTYHSVAVEGDALTTPLLAIWQHLTSPAMNGLLKLTMELHQRAIQGDLQTKDFLERESQQGVDSLSILTNDRAISLALFYLFQGAILDFLTTGNSQRGQAAITAFLRTIE